MTDSKLRRLSMEFSVEIIELVKHLRSNRESVISGLIGKCGTGIGAGIHEAQYTQNRKEYVSRLEDALKDAAETGYWIELLYRTKYIDVQTFKALSGKCISLRTLLLATCKTAKETAK